ncbi:hypothetical protein G6F37_004389 [Rhizopus arrhizus]|nr:hypothetical protein G6F38_004536 [Rhizopus arrhizus]KAG1159988.1 hypothetical protein G6F37_004389 [Rhizopus arrhizus]
MNIFNKLALKKEENKAEEHTNTIADINTKKLTSIAGNRLKRTLDEAINNSEGPSSAMTNESTYDTDEITDESSGSSTFRRHLIDKSENNAYKKLFSYVDWNKIVLAFENDLLLPEARIQEKLMTKWEYAAGLALISNSFEDSQVFLASAFAKKKSNESDYTDQIWLPIFKSLFAINDFKTDIRFIFDYKGLEFDIGGAEVCLPNANITKVTDDEAKLLREGKSIANSLNNVSSGDVCFSWFVQISGLRAYFSTAPICIGELNDTTKSLEFFKTVVQFRNGIEDSAHIIQSKITQTNKRNNAISDKFSDSGMTIPPHTTQQPLSQTWYTSPRKEQKKSIFPHYNLQLLETGSDTIIEDIILDSPSPSVTINNEVTTEDSCGLVKAGDGWYHPGLRKYFDTHPLE